MLALIPLYTIFLLNNVKKNETNFRINCCYNNVCKKYCF